MTKRASDLLANRVDRWSERARRATERQQTLVYERTGGDDRFLPLIISPENARSKPGDLFEAPFKIANSMREVQPEINILVSPIKERLFATVPDGVREWEMPDGGGDE